MAHVLKQKEEDMSSSYSIGQMNQLANRLEEEGFTAEDITNLGQYKGLSGIRGLINGTHELRLVHIINCDADPFCPDEWEVEEHRKGGQWKFDPEKIKFYLSKNQMNGKTIDGSKLRKRVARKAVLNGNVLEYLLAHPELIPEEWRGTNLIFFWGTIYRIPSSSDFSVRCLEWNGLEWRGKLLPFDMNFDSGTPAVLRAN